MSSGAAHGPLFLSGPFILTIVLRNSTLSLLMEKWDFDFRQLYLPYLCYFLTCRCLFTCKGARSWRFNIWDTSAFTSCGTLSPTFYGVMKIIRWRFFVGIQAGTLLLTFPTPIEGCSTFWIFNSQESVWGALPYFRKLPLAIFLISRTLSSSAP